MSRSSACSAAAWGFARVEEFWSRYQPLSPYGKDAKEARLVLADKASIEALYDATEAALRLLESCTADPSRLDRITYHLRRVPRICLEAPERGASYDLIELFQVKKFIANYRALGSLAGPGAREFFRLDFDSTRLAEALELGGSDPETFYISDAYDPRLKELRARIASLDAAAAECRARACARALSLYGIDFGGRDFAIVRRDAAAGPLSDRGSFSVEAYDDSSYVIRPEPGEDELSALCARASAAEEEAKVEAEVLAGLSVTAIGELPRLALYAEALTAFDLALARASLARQFRLARPVLEGGGAGEGKAAPPPLALEGGRYLPCEWDCERLAMRYSPLDLTLAEPAAVIFGSNMGGKTVALETALFMQILAQAGFHVPAARYATSVYPLLHYVGDSRGSGGGAAGGAGAGLSGFGFEIRSFVEAWEGGAAGAFLVFDEFARTTSSLDAEAILSAVIEALAGRPGTRALFSTHFRGVRRSAGVRYLRVRGLDREAARRAISADGEPLAERIRRINGMMEYGLVDEAEGGGGGSDAIAIAALLGLDRGIADRAGKLFSPAAAK
jgi:hypothetical protein